MKREEAREFIEKLRDGCKKYHTMALMSDEAIDDFLSTLPEEEESEWIDYSIQKPELGIEVIAQSNKWIDEDYNPQGKKIGFQNLSMDDDGEFISAKWNNEQDYYMTEEGSLPERWMHLPEFNPSK